jgi:hypothetical protein
MLPSSQISPGSTTPLPQVPLMQADCLAAQRVPTGQTSPSGHWTLAGETQEAASDAMTAMAIRQAAGDKAFVARMDVLSHDPLNGAARSCIKWPPAVNRRCAGRAAVGGGRVEADFSY